jgi:hypothetical protein
MVAPSFVTVISPSGEIKILSRPGISFIPEEGDLSSPRGPNDVLMMLVTIYQLMLADRLK